VSGRQRCIERVHCCLHCGCGVSRLCWELWLREEIGKEEEIWMDCTNGCRHSSSLCENLDRGRWSYIAISRKFGGYVLSCAHRGV